MGTGGPILALIGLRGSGKSTLGRQLAERLARPFIELDDLTPRVLGAASVAEAWSHHGEAEFRRAELIALREAMSRPGSITALGGGTPMAPGAADLLRAERDAGRLRIAYLAAGASTLRARLEAGDMTQRPSLTGADPLVEIEAVLAVRDPVYRDLADAVIETEGRTPDAVLADLAELAA